MTCHCSCHELPYNYFSATHIMPSPMSTCSACCPIIKVTANNVENVVLEVRTMPDKAMLAVRYEVLVGPKNGSPLDRFKIGFVVTDDLAPMPSAQNMLLRKMTADFLNKEWAKMGQPDWARHALSAPVFIVGSGLPMSSDYVDGHVVVNDLSRLLPGLRSRVDCPLAECNGSWRVQKMIVHLNDNHLWTRGQIADWLESLDVDLSFPVDEPSRGEEPSAQVELAKFALEDYSSKVQELLQMQIGQFITPAGWQTPSADPIGDLKSAMADLKKQTQNHYYHVCTGPDCDLCAMFYMPTSNHANHVHVTVDEIHHQPAHDPKAVALQKKKQQAAHQAHLKNNPTKSKPTK